MILILKLLVMPRAIQPDGQIRIPLNEEASVGTGQIKEFLIAFNGEGINILY